MWSTLKSANPISIPPPHIVDAAQQALHSGYTHYGPPMGLPELREAIAKDVSRFRGISVNPDQVVVTPGAKPIMFYAILALAQPGDEVIYPDPGFPIYESVIRFAGAQPVPIALKEERAFSLDMNELADLITERTRLLIINSPQNPTSGIIPPGDLEAIAEIVVDKGIPVLADEIYSRILLRKRIPQHLRLRGHAGPDHHPGRLLQDLRHDGMAHRLRGDAAKPCG